MPRALIIVQDLTDRGKGLRDSCPDPLGAIGHHTRPDLVCGNQPRLFDLAQCGKQCLVVLNLMPAQDVDDPLVVHQVEPKAFGLTPRALPARPLGPRLFAPGPAAPGALRPGGHIGPLNGQYHNGPSALPRGRRGYLGGNLLAGGCHLP